MIEPNRLPWYRELNRYHWFVLVVCTLGWLFDCLDQQLFNIARPQAIGDLIPAGHRPEDYTGLATSILLVGWATGGIIFGIMGDRLGRAKTMVWTILAYSVFTGLSGFSVTVWDFIFYRFMTGLGVGGQFAVGVSLVAEVMPDRARPHALGMLQAFSAAGNIAAGGIGMAFTWLAMANVLPNWWRWMFAVGALPALLATIVIARLKEPERWQQSVAEKGKQRAGSLREMFTDPVWRRNAIVGVILASAGVIGLWAIGVFSNDLIQSVFRKEYRQEAREAGEAAIDRQFVRLVIERPEALEQAKDKVKPSHLLSLTAEDKDPEVLYGTALTLHEAGKPVTAETVLAALDSPAGSRSAQSSVERLRRQEYLRGTGGALAEVAPTIAKIVDRREQINGKVGWWASFNLMLFNVGAFFGMYLFKQVTQKIGRRPTFAICFVLSMLATAAAFTFIRTPSDIYWMTPLMGAAQLSVFGGYAIYFPELFPTRMRATGTSVCYNIARYFAAVGPYMLTWLTTQVYAAEPEPMRNAGVTMCLVYLAGIAVLPFAPETKDKPLPE